MMDFTRMHAVGLGVLLVVGGVAAQQALHASDEALPPGVALTDVRETDLDAPTARDHTGETRALATKVEALTAEVEALRALMAQQRADQRADAAGDDVLPSEAEHHEMWEEYVSYAEAGFNDEPTDTRWAAETGSLIQQQIASWPALRGATQSLECRSKSCRVELRDDGSQNFARELPRLVHRLGPQVSSVVVDLVKDEQGRLMQVLYMSRAESTQRAL